MKEILRGPYTISTACLLVGVSLAIGHHAFYQSLHGQPPPTDYVGLSTGVIPPISKQRINIAAGLILATLVRTFLGISIGTAQEQFSWRGVKMHPTKLGQIDSLFLSKSGITNLLKLRLWRHFPVAMLLALLYWLIPIVAIVTPTTLNIIPSLVIESSMMKVPIVDFTNITFANVKVIDHEDDTDGLNKYDGPVAPVARAVARSILGGDVVSYLPPFTNSSYRTSVVGPALKCHDVGNSTEFWKKQAMSLYNASISYVLPDQVGPANILYLSYPNTGDIPWESKDGYDYTFSPAGISGPPYGFTIIARAYDYHDILDNTTMVQCELWDATYSTHFTYQEGIQTISSTITSYGSLVTQELSVHAPSLVLPDFPFNPDPDYMTGWAYISLLDAFQTYLTGSIIENINELQHSISVDTKVTLTELPFTRKLDYLQQSLAGLDAADFDETKLHKMAVKDVLEEMFKNATISLGSEEALTQYPDPRYSPKPTNVTISTYQNIYTYTPSILWLTYGIAIGITALSVVAGCTVATLAGGAYSTKFSTILRVVHNVRLSDSIELEDTTGKDPLPSRLEKTRVYIPPDGRSVLVGGQQPGSEDIASWGYESRMEDKSEKTRSKEVSIQMEEGVME
ncbi:hypothetical protein NPX13_g9256 [Xylaria arbuscula]|uniref:Uncharacterized protein n=1 Tax=Xylaria arbuscula TaxID=114810 RepID=A0A9W8TJB9_9PEZI|nr:hypothetical protein NPX13_g9256 [Xylaria arbuscula]